MSKMTKFGFISDRKSHLSEFIVDYFICGYFQNKEENMHIQHWKCFLIDFLLRPQHQ